MLLGGAGYIISMYFTIFLTDAVNLSLNAMPATIREAVTDPVMDLFICVRRKRHQRFYDGACQLYFARLRFFTGDKAVDYEMSTGC